MSYQQAIGAQGVDNNAIAAQNNAQYAAFDRKPSNPWKDMAMDTIGNIAGSVTGSMTGGANSFSSNPWNNPDGRTNNKISR